MSFKHEEIDDNRRHLFTGAAATVIAMQLGSSAFADSRPEAHGGFQRVADNSELTETNPTIVLVHGAWADGSGWDRVLKVLQSRGLRTMAAPIPLTSLSDDLAALDRALERTDGPIVLVAHAYSGAVVGACHNERVRSLAFITSLTPDEGETVAKVFYREKSEAPNLAPDRHGYLWIPPDEFHAAWCQNASPEEAALLAATQRPISVACIQEKAPKPAWKAKPSWYFVAEQDRMINPATQVYLARRMGAQIQSEKVDHAALITAPEVVSKFIIKAAAGVAADQNRQGSSMQRHG
jgi:pimeloyl-ACP methyl ester carboxylesterase